MIPISGLPELPPNSRFLDPNSQTANRPENRCFGFDIQDRKRAQLPACSELPVVLSLLDPDPGNSWNPESWRYFANNHSFPAIRLIPDPNYLPLYSNYLLDGRKLGSEAEPERPSSLPSKSPRKACSLGSSPLKP